MNERNNNKPFDRGAHFICFDRFSKSFFLGLELFIQQEHTKSYKLNQSFKSKS
jgi:hypothetical protein